MKNEKGVTLVALIIIVSVLLILLGISIPIGTESIAKTRLQGFYTELEIIQKRVDDIAATNEMYLDIKGNAAYIKEQGQELTSAQIAFLQGVLESENISNVSASNFRYFTIQDLLYILDLEEMNYNVFIDFDNRIIIAEKGIEVNEKTYYLLETTTYFVKENNTNKNVGTIESLSYEVTKYGTDKYKVLITPSNIIGDLARNGYVKYKKTTTKYWETAEGTEIILELDIEYNIKYIDSNNNSLEKTIKVNSNLTVTEI